jgi:polysaccharide export outer membrane protein
MAVPRALQGILGILSVAAPLLLGGCYSAPVATEPETPPGPTTLGPGDRVRVIVFGQQQLSGDFVIGDDGSLSLPLVGRMPVAGLTAGQAEKAMRDRLGHGIIVNPEVSIDVLQYRPVYVVGEVVRPGGYELVGKGRVINAVALAGGFTYRARTDRIMVMRDGDPERKLVYVTERTPVGPGDTVIVPERWF